MRRLLTLCIATSALAGALLSIVLILEYHGITLSVSESVCRSGASGFNACQNVARSEYAAIHGIPLVGPVPTAVFGLLMFGFVLCLSILDLARKPESAQDITALIALISVITLFLDILLLYIMTCRIKAVCALCLMTYIANLCIGCSAIASLCIFYKESCMTVLKCSLSAAIRAVRNQFMIFVVIAFALLSIGLLIGAAAKSAMARSIDRVAASDAVKKAIQKFESTPESDLDNTHAPAVGPRNARIAITIFTDYTCDHCAAASKLFGKMMAAYPGLISITYRSYPLSDGCGTIPDVNASTDASCIGALAAQCAHRQHRFIDMHERLYRDNERGIAHSSKSVNVIAKSIGLSANEFAGCLSSPATQSQLALEAKKGDALGIEGTPTIFINKRKVIVGLPPESVVRGLIDYLRSRGK